MRMPRFWCIQLVPQLWTNYRTKDTEGLPGTMMFLWAICGVPFGVYAIVQKFNIPIQIQPQIFTLLALTGWGQTLVYHSSWRIWTATVIVLLTGITFLAIELTLVLTLRNPYSHGVVWPITLIGIIAVVVLVMGLIPPYLEIYQRRGRVVGIDFTFLTIDWMGAFFSLMALVAQRQFDVLGGVNYTVCLVLETGIFASHGFWVLRTATGRKEAELRGEMYDYQERKKVDFAWLWQLRCLWGKKKGSKLGLKKDGEMVEDGLSGVEVAPVESRCSIETGRSHVDELDGGRLSSTATNSLKDAERLEMAGGQ